MSSSVDDDVSYPMLERLTAVERKEAYAAAGKLKNRFPGRVGALVSQLAIREIEDFLTFGHRVDQLSIVPALLRALADEDEDRPS